VSRNEGNRLRRTVDDVFLHGPEEDLEIVIVDDASDDDSAAFVTDAAYAGKPMRTVRNDRHRGLIYSRARAADLARGSYLAFLDAHCAVTPGWLEALADELLQIDGQGLVAPAIYTLQPDWTIDFESGGAAACTLSNPFLDFTWTAPQWIEGRPCTCTIGGGAWMCHRRWYGHIGRMDAGMVIWGLENIDVPLRTWAAGGWCLAAAEVGIGHLFKETPAFLMSDVDYIYNKVRAAHNVFTAETFKRVMTSLMCLRGFREAFTRVHQERDALTPFKDHFESIRQRSDAWLIDTFRLPLFEAPAYHFAPRRAKPVGTAEVPRPGVSVVVPVADTPGDLGQLLTSLLERTTYGNFDVLLALAGEGAGPRGPRHLIGRWREHPRIRVIEPAEGENIANAAARVTDSEFLALLPPDAGRVDPHWLEEFLLLAERHPRLLLAGARTRWPGAPGSKCQDTFEDLWDWDAPGLLQPRTGQPLATRPYQVLSCPDSLLLVRRRAFVHLGGFDPTVVHPVSVLELAIRGWLSGFESFCHPGITVERTAQPDDAFWPSTDAARHYASVLPAVTCLSGSRRQRTIDRFPDAAPRLSQHAQHIDRRRNELLAGARHGDDWLFFKFHLEESPMTPVQPMPADIRTQLQVRATFPLEPGRLTQVLKVLEESGGGVRAHLVYRLYEQAVAFFLCPRPSEAALALNHESVAVDTETVVTVATRDHPELLRHLVHTLESERIDVSYTYASRQGEQVLLVFRTGDNPRAEDVLRNYLLPTQA
jgi:glycosyltransferase involved in cell wall biosynthesis